VTWTVHEKLLAVPGIAKFIPAVTLQQMLRCLNEFVQLGSERMQKEGLSGVVAACVLAVGFAQYFPVPQLEQLEPPLEL
jgi:hypothetical protein